jgi:hypothetical protein
MLQNMPRKPCTIQMQLAPSQGGLPDDVLRQLRLVPKWLRDDAVQEAHVAMSTGENPVYAVRKLTDREKARSRRFRPFLIDENGNQFAVMDNGERMEL